jgi:hypothetical protein
MCAAMMLQSSGQRFGWYVKIVPFLAFFARIDPAQSIANPACMKLSNSEQK